MKKNYAYALVALLASAVIAGCAGKPPNEFADCVFPDDGRTTAPAWVCGGPYQDLKVFAVGSHEKTAAGIDFQRTMAAASARDFLASQLRTTVQGMVKRFTETTGAADSETVDRMNASVSKQITKETLVGSRIYTMRPNPKTGMLYVLVGLDDDLVKEYARQALRTSMNNEKALWQQLRAKKSFDELAEDIAKLD